MGSLAHCWWNANWPNLFAGQFDIWEHLKGIYTFYSCRYALTRGKYIYLDNLRKVENDPNEAKERTG